MIHEATNVRAMGYPGFSTFGDSPDDLKEPGGCEAGDVWSDRLSCLRDQQSNHAKRLEVAPSDHAGTAIRDKPIGKNLSRPERNGPINYSLILVKRKSFECGPLFFPRRLFPSSFFAEEGPSFFLHFEKTRSYGCLPRECKPC